MNVDTWTSARCHSANCCVEVMTKGPKGVHVRDSKDPQGPELVFTPDEWNAFIRRVKDGEFDL